MDKAQRNEMIEHLLKLDSYTYSWLKSLKAAVVNNPKSKQDKVEQPVKAQKRHRHHRVKRMFKINSLKILKKVYRIF
jgi:hypothetical protein